MHVPRPLAMLRPAPALRRPARWGALAVGTGLALLAFPAPNLSVLAWFGLVPGLLLIRAAATGREAGVRGWWLASGYIVAAMYWLAPEIGPGVGLVALGVGVLLVPFRGFTSLPLRRRPPLTAARALAALVVVPSCWLLVQWLRSWQALGGPWAVLGASQWQHPVFLALAAVGGVWLVSFALVLANTGLVIAVVASGWRVRLLGAVAALAALAAGPVAFALTPAAPVTRQVTVALVQP